MRSRKCKICDGWHDLEQPWPAECAAHYTPRGNPAPMTIADSMPWTQHPVTGRYHDSKSALRRDTRESGCVELGNDAPKASRPQIEPMRRAGRDYKDAIDQARASR